MSPSEQPGTSAGIRCLTVRTPFTNREPTWSSGDGVAGRISGGGSSMTAVRLMVRPFDLSTRGRGCPSPSEVLSKLIEPPWRSPHRPRDCIRRSDCSPAQTSESGPPRLRRSQTSHPLRRVVAVPAGRAHSSAWRGLLVDATSGPPQGFRLERDHTEFPFVGQHLS